ncbi:hypothetical protein BK125_04795 [Paenibacillus odorifer]|uniref:Uncharacterized protein n=1 Tax=Paenibacillus odorifer TaxID=189426 RepID=A0ABX3GRI6_9BACL|nr:hypothetical protein [Paenibacillus odorifer]OMC79601.1 hypothetical protein BK125_04795 [Paenibacillus odorifer]OMD34947.1 hypothetical protein BSO21_10040 [Paenibacillus odorifer]
MSIRTSASLFIFSLIISLSSALYFFTQYRDEIDKTPFKYEEIQAEYDNEAEKILQANGQIWQDMLDEFVELGGNLDDLSKYDDLRFVTNGVTSNELLNSIDHPDLLSISLPKPPSGEELKELIDQDVKVLNDELDYKINIIIFAEVIFTLLLTLLFISTGKLRERKKTAPNKGTV